MSRQSGTRKEALFAILVLAVITIFSTFVLAAFKISREAKAEIAVFWAILYTAALAIVSLLYLTVLVAYYRQLSFHGSTFAINFILGVAWAVALVAELIDPNNTFPRRKEVVEQRGEKGESDTNFRARVALSGVTAFLLLIVALAGSLRTMGITMRTPPEGASVSPGGRHDMELAERSAEVPSGAPPARNSIMVVLARVGIVKGRSTTTVRTEF